MEGGDVDRRDKPPDLVQRETLCMSLPIPNHILHRGDTGYREELQKHYRLDESNALERLVKFKAALKKCRAEEDFWPMATEGLAEITGAQYAFISKRMVLDDEDAAVEMPPFGEEGSCLMAQALYFNDGKGNKGNPRNVKYHVYGCPCEYMKHDKVLLIPERLNELVVDNPNKGAFVVPAEAYLAIPLVDDDGKCFAHFGAMWSKDGLAKLNLGWGFIEMMFHSLEDILLAGFLQRGRFASALKAANPNAVIPHDAITAAQSLKPYAKSLSHELRTPMQGVVGMLDVMYATVQEAAEGHSNDRAIRAIFENLKDNIEVVQDSSRRAVEAADNVVHAYDMDMGVPDTPMSPPGGDYDHPNDHKAALKRLGIVVTGENVPINFKNHKRRRGSNENLSTSATKYRKTTGNPPLSPIKSPLQAHVSALDHEPALYEETHFGLSDPIRCPPGLRHTNLRDVLQFLVNDLLKVGGRPESAIAQEKEGGEEIEVRVRSPNGDEKIKTVHWTVHPSVPDTIMIDEQTLVKVISSMYSNAVKFTEEGKIELHARLSPRSRYVVLTVSDSGSGITDDFKPKLFQAFSKEDDSLTRHSEGLGLGLMVAKGLARKLGGDLLLVRTNTSGPNRGSEFELRIPVTPGDITSRPTTPSGGSPAPSRRSSPAHVDDVGSLRSRSDSLRPLLASSAHQNIASPRHRSPPKRHGTETPSPPYLTSLGPTSSAASTTSNVVRTPRRLSTTKRAPEFDRLLAQKHPLTFLVVEDNEINRKLLLNMLAKLGYQSGRDVFEAYNGNDAVRKVQLHRENSVKTRGTQGGIDVVLMDLWMPLMDGYEATQKILGMEWDDDAVMDDGVDEVVVNGGKAEKGIVGNRPTILAVTADVTGGALEKAAGAGMKGFLTKPFKLVDLEKLILEYCATRPPVSIDVVPA